MASSGQTEHLFVGFNEDATSLQVGMHSGYIIYNLAVIDKIDPVYMGISDDEAARYIERLFSSSLVAYVLHKSPRKMRAFHFEKKRKVCTQSYTNTIVAIKMNRDYLVVCLEDSIVIHSILDLKIKHQIRDVPENKKGIIDLTSDGTPLIAYPGTAGNGRVSLFDLSKMTPSLAISAHASPIAELRFSPDGKLLVTSSVKGTVIRIFNIQTGERCYEFTRGVKRYVTISSLAFSKNSKYVCLSSNTETVHVFKLEKSTEEIQAQYTTPTWAGYFARAASSYLPTHMNELIYREKSFATARLPKAGLRNAAALRFINGKLYLLVATTDGFLYCYFVDPNGGECSIEFQHKIGNQIDSVNSEVTIALSKIRSEDNRSNENGSVVSDLDEFPPMDHTV